MALDPTWKRFLVDLWAHDGERELKDGAETLAGIRGMELAGYIRLVRARSGPLGVYTGTYFAQLTDAGRAEIANAV